MRLAPEVLRAGRMEWQLFVTLTWRGQVPRPARRERCARLYFRRLAREARVPYGNLVWFCREEGGEIGHRPHFHVLIAGFPSSTLNLEFGAFLGQVWESGWCEARLWMPGLGAVDYSCEDGANIYEGKKFRANLPIMFSESLARVVVPVTGDNVEKEDAEHSEYPAVAARSGAGSKCQQQPGLTDFVPEGLGYLVAVNASRTCLKTYYQADITGTVTAARD